jgi:hypothetical protein
MTFWDGTRWIDQSKPSLGPRRNEPRGLAARFVDILATTGMALILGALFVPFTPALATGPVLTVSPSSGAPGSTIQVSGTAFPAGSKVQVAWDGSGSGMPVAQVNGNGAFKAALVVPNSAAGSHTISAVQLASKSARSGSTTPAPLANVTFTLFNTGVQLGSPAPPTGAPAVTPDPSVTAPTPTVASTLGPDATPGPPATSEPSSTSDPGPTPTFTQGPSTTSTPAPTPTFAMIPSPSPSPLPSPTLAPTHLVALGAYIPGAPSDPTKIDAYGSLTGVMPNIVMWYQEWSGDWNAFYAKGADAVRSRGATPLISWEPWAGTNDPAWALSTISDGSHDAYIHQWTHDVAAWGHTIYVRPMYEMNGPWSAWGYGVNGNTAAQYVAAWRHIVAIANSEGATNIRWVWCPNVDDGDPRYASYASLYPGDAYVDWVGLDGYNWGTSQSWSTWQSIYAIFNGSVDKVRAITSKPVMIAETGSTELGGDKAAWITNGFTSLVTDLPEIRALVWFNTSAQADWRVNTSTQSLAAYRAVAASGAFAGLLP